VFVALLEKIVVVVVVLNCSVPCYWLLLLMSCGVLLLLCSVDLVLVLVLIGMIVLWSCEFVGVISC